MSPAPEKTAPEPAARLTLAALLVPIILLIAPGLAFWRLAPRELVPWIAGWIALASLITYLLYARDKRRARLGEWRTPEAVLHGWELAGGWPGAWLAQRRLRHKNAKLSFQAVFWLIVVIYNYIALHALLGWRIAGAVADLFQS